jgi:hypothetical protein
LRKCTNNNSRPITKGMAASNLMLALAYSLLKKFLAWPVYKITITSITTQVNERMSRNALV